MSLRFRIGMAVGVVLAGLVVTLSAICNADGGPERMAGSLTNLSTRGLFDPLTGLPNRLMLQRQLEHLFGDRRFGKAALVRKVAGGPV